MVPFEPSVDHIESNQRARGGNAPIYADLEIVCNEASELQYKVIERSKIGGAMT